MRLNRGKAVFRAPPSAHSGLDRLPYREGATANQNLPAAFSGVGVSPE